MLTIAGQHRAGRNGRSAGARTPRHQAQPRQSGRDVRDDESGGPVEDGRAFPARPPAGERRADQPGDPQDSDAAQPAQHVGRLHVVGIADRPNLRQPAPPAGRGVPGEPAGAGGRGGPLQPAGRDDPVREVDGALPVLRPVVRRRVPAQRASAPGPRDRRAGPRPREERVQPRDRPDPDLRAHRRRDPAAAGVRGRAPAVAGDRRRGVPALPVRRATARSSTTSPSSAPSRSRPTNVASCSPSAATRATCRSGS